MSASGKTTKTLVWILMAMLIFGLGGFGITNLGGAVRSVGQVGDKPITTESYARGLRQSLQGRQGPSGRPLTFAEARAQGLDGAVLSQLVATRALDHETSQLGLSVGDDRLAANIRENTAFADFGGSFSRPAYQDRLRSIGLSEREYEAILREEIARGLLETAVFSDMPTSEIYPETIVGFIGERRDFTWALLTEDALDAPLAEAMEAELRAYHEANSAAYMSPALKNITYAWITPARTLASIEVDEAEVRARYEERSAEYNREARRLVERLVFPDDATASAAKASLDAGNITFEALVEERGLELSDADMGDVTEDELAAAGASVFAASAGDVVGPLLTDLGPALFRVNAVIEAQITPFEDVKAELRDELAQSRAARRIEAEVDTYEDLLAGGATLEEIADETDMDLGTIGWHPAAEDGPAGYEAFRAAAVAVQQGDFPELISLDDGGLLALRLDSEAPAALRPFEEVAETVEADAREARLTEALIAKAETLKAALTEGRTFDALGLTPQLEEGLTRSDFIAEAPAGLIVDIFAMDTAGQAVVVVEPGRVALAQLDAVRAPDMTDPDLTAARSLLEQQLEADMAQDIFQMFVADIQSRTAVSLDQNAINAVNAQFQ